jgi:uncharacterized protein (TIGR02145 family)
MKRRPVITILFATFFTLTSFEKNANKTTNYVEVQIGTQIWMKKNLDINVFRNGEVIPEAKTSEEWNKFNLDGKPAWCYYKNDKANGKKYGKLYNFYAVSDPRGLAPNGWHIPTEEEWWTLRTLLKLGNNGETMRSSTNDWYNENGKSYKGTDSSGFSGLPGGERGEEFNSLGLCGAWWSSTKKYSPPTTAYYIQLMAFGGVYGNSGHYSFGRSIRCIKD